MCVKTAVISVVNNTEKSRTEKSRTVKSSELNISEQNLRFYNWFIFPHYYEQTVKFDDTTNLTGKFTAWCLHATRLPSRLLPWLNDNASRFKLASLLVKSLRQLVNDSP